ncbi:hypothetical protein H9X85_10015 [Anaerotignum lactatifermentans]|uniref:GP-PDE domain-containing protein n=1 Tax=Anaerotignum lactatifermentans TaxID=160404 RepID=A0ABS2GA86_9FIRM|nr:phosphatidylinositol-specific phospholipase C/glycerophosphodiester phosphodiesterase family protein [Anaerotignum lactatifermentans]MBM6829877.1 hypothetical protein [Anaerotignum lactatifermentans]MBM6878379.1 hypothetical protein [Anaerotignum lactatifermentans]MBM6951534.1 hypothetical protein [Anaerotignum lactatifermentans]
MKTKRLSAMAMAAMLGVLLAPGRAAYAAEAGWTAENPLIAHALGEYDGKIETNSKEAFIASWENGYRVLEADFIYTSDNALAVRHDFDKDGSYYRLEIRPSGSLEMSSQAFQQNPIIYEQTPMMAADLLYLMAEYQDVYLVTDTKDTDEATVKKQFADLKKIAENIGHPEVLDRIIPQIYNESMLTWVKSVYDFPQWIYTLYQAGTVDYAETAQFCADHNIGVVTIEKSKVTAQIVETFRAKGIQVYAHTVNRYLQFEDLLVMGVSGIYTDSIKPYELDWVGLSNSRSIVQKQVKLKNSEFTLDTIDIMGVEYVRLRDFAAMMSSAGGGFSAVYSPDSDTLALKSSGKFTTLGNELLLTDSDHLITQKADNLLTYNGDAVTMQGYTVDGDLFYPLQELLRMTDRHITQTETGFVIQTGAAVEEAQAPAEDANAAAETEETTASAPAEETTVPAEDAEPAAAQVDSE